MSGRKELRCDALQVGCLREASEIAPQCYCFTIAMLSLHLDAGSRFSFPVLATVADRRAALVFSPAVLQRSSRPPMPPLLTDRCAMNAYHQLKPTGFPLRSPLPVAILALDLWNSCISAALSSASLTLLTQP